MTRPTLIDDGFLDESDERIPSSKPYRLVPDSPRRGCSVIPFIVLALLLAAATPSGAPNRGNLRPVVGSELRGAPQNVRADGSGEARSKRSDAGGTSPATESGTPQDASAVTFEGILSWVDPSYGARYLALPQPRGTRARICGPSDCVTRISTDYGPDQRANPDRIADLSAADFERVCGMNAAQRVLIGLCPGTVTLAGLPATSTK